MKRLVSNKRFLQKTSKLQKMKKTASYMALLHNFVTNTGDQIEMSAYISCNRLYYNVEMLHQYYNSSFYNGMSFDDAFSFYIELVTALKSISEAERISRLRQTIKRKAIRLLDETALDINRKRHHLYFKQPLFLGINDPC